MTKYIPTELKHHILPFNWDVRKVWALESPVETVAIKELCSLLELPFWSSRPNAGMLFDLSPRTALENLDRYPHQKQRIIKADVRFPIDFIVHEKRYYVLDGLHRLARLSLEEANAVSIRKHTFSVRERIQVGASTTKNTPV